MPAVNCSCKRNKEVLRSVDVLAVATALMILWPWTTVDTGLMRGRQDEAPLTVSQVSLSVIAGSLWQRSERGHNSWLINSVIANADIKRRLGNRLIVKGDGCWLMRERREAVWREMAERRQAWKSALKKILTKLLNYSMPVNLNVFECVFEHWRIVIPWTQADLVSDVLDFLLGFSFSSWRL